MAIEDREEVKLPKGSEAGKGLFQSHSPLRFVTWAVTAVVEAIFTERERERFWEDRVGARGGGGFEFWYCFDVLHRICFAMDFILPVGHISLDTNQWSEDTPPILFHFSFECT
jgi:hypothetical protein